MKVILFLLSVSCLLASPFQWEDEVPQQPKLETQPKPSVPSAPAPISPQTGPTSPANPTPPPNYSQDPFSDPFFNGSMSIQDLHQQMRQRQEALLKQFGAFFDDPFFKSPPGFGFGGGLIPKGKLGNRFPVGGINSSNGLEVLNKKDFIVVQKKINPANQLNYKVSLQGRSVIVSSETKQQNEENSQYGRSFSQSFSSSSESVILPEDVLADFTQRVVGDKLVLVFQKK